MPNMRMGADSARSKLASHANGNGAPKSVKPNHNGHADQPMVTLQLLAAKVENSECT